MRVRDALKQVRPDGMTRDIISAGALGDLSVSPSGVVKFSLKSDMLSGADPDTVRAMATTAAEAVPGVARVVLAGGAPMNLHENPLGLARPGAPGQDRDKNARIAAGRDVFPGVRKVLAIASGKGGVGKSTVAVNVALAFSRAGYRTGLLDGDIHGPSLPTLLGLGNTKPEIVSGRIMPLERFGMKVMSIGFLVDAQRAIAWRGPMVMGAMRQLMSDVDWGVLDILVIDTPPATGDVYLTLAQTKRLDGVAIVSTPQELALADVRRAAAFFRQTGTPILGIIENMAWLVLATGERMHVFGEGGAQRAADDLGAPFLGALPLLPDLRAASDAGRPPALDRPEGAEAVAFEALARRLAADLGL